MLITSKFIEPWTIGKVQINFDELYSGRHYFVNGWKPSGLYGLIKKLLSIDDAMMAVVIWWESAIGIFIETVIKNKAHSHCISGKEFAFCGVFAAKVQVDTEMRIVALSMNIVYTFGYNFCSLVRP